MHHIYHCNTGKHHRLKDDKTDLAHPSISSFNALQEITQIEQRHERVYEFDETA